MAEKEGNEMKEIGGNDPYGLGRKEGVQTPSIDVRELTDIFPESISVGTTTITRLSELDMPIQEYLERTVRRNSDRKRYFLLTWEGQKTPYGADISGEIVSYARSGRIESTENEIIGNYERLLTNGGPEGNEQCILVDTRKRQN